MIAGIGIDNIEIERVRKACEKEAFVTRCYTDKEKALFQGEKRFLYEKAAGNFAVKEAVSKVFGTGFQGIALKDIEVLRDEMGKPYVNLYGVAKQLAQKQNINHIHISITNTKEYATAFAVGETVTVQNE